MSPQPRPGPQSSKPHPQQPAGPRELNSIPSETDVAELAARFAEKGGGGITAEMSSELALEVVLNEIVEQACQSTQSTGAAIALERDGEMVCRASSGATAPDLGARLDTSSGLTGECCRTRQTQRCQDALADPRVDIEASARLGVRSVIVMPLLRGDQLVGVFELLSCWPSAFGEREERAMEELASRAVRGLDGAEQAMRPRPAKKEEKPDVYPADDLALARKIAESQRAEIASSESANTQLQPPQVHPENVQPAQAMPLNTQPSAVQYENVESMPERRRAGFDFLSFALGAAVLACTALLGVTLGRRVEARRITAQSHPNVPAAAVPVEPAPAPTAGTVSADANATHAQAASPKTGAAPSSSVASSVPPGGLVVYDGGREVFRMPPNPAGSSASPTKPVTAASPTPSSSAALEKILKLAPAEAEKILASRVEPEYPEEARRQKIQGSVVLAIRIGTDGGVEDMQFVSGPSQLAEAAVNAVKRWRYKPQSVNGHPVQIQTRVTLDFRLPG